MTDLDRRSFLKRGGVLAGATLATSIALNRIEGAVHAAGSAAPASGAAAKGGYGELSRRRAVNEPSGVGVE